MTEPLYRPADGNGWRCFHCDEVFLTPGAAADHFGSSQMSVPGCQIKAGEERGLLMALRRAEEEVAELRAVYEMMEYRAEAAGSMIGELKFYFGKDVNSVLDAWHKYESMEGRVIALEYQRTLSGQMEILRWKLHDLGEVLLQTIPGRMIQRTLDRLAR
jgi:hypothetical protein